MISIPSIMSNSRRSDSMLCDRLDNINEQMADNQKDGEAAFDDFTVILDKNHQDQKIMTSLSKQLAVPEHMRSLSNSLISAGDASVKNTSDRPRPMNINISCEEYQTQDRQLPLGFDMIFMGYSDPQNEKLLID